MPQSTHTRWSDIPVEPMNPLLGRQFTVGANVMISRITLQAGAHVPLHSHPNEQIAILLTGCLQFLLEGKEIILRPGELLAIPPDIPHEVFAIEDTINLDIFSPPRQDWIDGSDAYLREPAK
jgi:quercetin dioxygenase-like cupin family protein